METVSNMASAASKAIWGDQTTKDSQETPETAKSDEEPVSGEVGDVKAGEPYDKGNLDSTSTDKTTGAITTTSDITTPPITTTTNTMPSATEPSLGAADTSGVQPPAQKASEELKGLENLSIKDTNADTEGAQKTEGAGPSTLQDETTGRPPATDAPKSELVGTSDTTKPPAVKEADPLAAQKAVQPTTPSKSSKDEEDTGSDSKGGKPSMKEKIKAKLHIKDKNKSDS